MNAKRMFKKLVIYVDCCYSGSMFDGILPDNMNVYAMTAASASELAFFTFCDLPVIEVCLATVFSHSWIDNSEAMNASVETLADQFEAVGKLVTSANVSNYGDLSIKNELVAEFQGKHKSRIDDSKENVGQYAHYTKDALPLRYLESKLRRATSPEARDKLTKSLQLLKAKRFYHDSHTRSLIANITNNHHLISSIINEIPLKIGNLDCHDNVVIAYHRLCFNLGKNPYAQNAVRALTNLCEREYSTNQILAAIHVHCAFGPKFDDIH
ncbi:hypothetical protein M3Y94_00629700 [Aphelenchoides besseyi]|nr:hypothetical protein M3Y94_00629700 [Aphelenchoides besseyi]